ncbi:hypothetical protein K440DRAFT_602223, partial [Wilcoxina mikolae CBS 423.85]
MADPLSIAASVAGLISLAETVIGLGYQYHNDAKGFPADFERLLSEISSLYGVLCQIKLIVSRPGRTSNISFHSINDCDSTLREIVGILESTTPRAGKTIQNAAKKLLWPLKKGDTEALLIRLEHNKSTFSLALSAEQLHVVQDLRAESLEQKLWRDKEGELRAGEKRSKVIKWLCTAMHESRHIDIQAERKYGTGKWLLETDEFKQWKEGKAKSRLLWGRGIPGAGKTFLSSTVIDHLLDQSSKPGVAYIYFDYNEQDRQKPTDVLSSLVRQLSGQSGQLPKILEDLYDELKPKEKQPSLQSLYDAIVALSKQFPQVYIICDALDECDQQKQRTTLLPLFHQLGQNGVNLFMTSRPYPEDIQDSFQDITTIELSANESDIRSYIRETINQNLRAKRLVQNAKCEERIISQLMDCAKGMFLLVRFHINFLCSQTTPRKILTELDNLKNTPTRKEPLDPTYDRAFGQLNRQPEGCVRLGLKIISWLSKARRTLTVEELRIAVSVEPNTYELDDLDLPDRMTLTDVCSGLVVIEENSNTIRFAHFTVLEWLLRKSIIPEGADLDIAITCITYLTFDAFSGGPCGWRIKDRFQNNQFLQYAADQMPFHMGQCDEELTT